MVELEVHGYYSMTEALVSLSPVFLILHEFADASEMQSTEI